MAFDFRELNKHSASVMRPGIETEGMEFKHLKDFVGQELVIDGFYFSKSKKYGKDQVVIIANGYQINMPARSVDEFQIIKDNPDAVQSVKEGRMKLVNIEMADTKNGTTTIYDFDNN